MWLNRPTDQSVTLWKPAVARERCFTFTIKDKWYISSYCLLFVVKVEAGRFLLLLLFCFLHMSVVWMCSPAGSHVQMCISQEWDVNIMGWPQQERDF